MRVAVFGATGRLGRQVVDHALAAGHVVVAHVRSPDKLGTESQQLRIVTGDLADEASVQLAVEGCHAVISCVGWVKGQTPDVYGRGMAHIVDAMVGCDVPRLVAISGAGLALGDDVPSLGRRVILFLLRVFGGDVLAGKEAEWSALQASTVAWTAVRVPRMVERPAKGGVQVDLHQVSGQPMVPYADVAAWMVERAGDRQFVGQAPFVSGT